jgi:mannose-1-phosphate guanylyltransferase
MKAFLLAAGLGTRLRPITDTTPKCLVEINGKPLLEWWFELFQKYGVDDILINTHYLAEQVEDFVGRYTSGKENIMVKTFYEKELMGSGGTVYANRDFIGEDEDFFICYADNLTNVNLKELLEEHKKNKAVLTMALFRTNLPKQCGIATLGKSGVITDFVEKPENPTSNLANAGIYVASKKLYKYFDGNGFCDFGKDILPKLTGEMYGYEIQAYLRDIGTIENLQLARKEWTYDNF